MSTAMSLWSVRLRSSGDPAAYGPRSGERDCADADAVDDMPWTEAEPPAGVLGSNQSSGPGGFPVVPDACPELVTT